MTKMMDLDLTTHRVAIYGRVAISYTVNDKFTPVSNALVEIIPMDGTFQRQLLLKSLRYGQKWDFLSNRPDRTLTAEDGSFYFMDLPEGKYQIKASMLSANYSKKTSLDADKSLYIKKLLKIDKNQPISIWTIENEKKLQPNENKPKWIDLILNVSSITGQIRDEEKNSPIAYAQIELIDSMEYTLCDRDGKFQLLYLKPPSSSSIKLIISAPGYAKSTVKNITLSPGVIQSIPLSETLLKKANGTQN